MEPRKKEQMEPGKRYRGYGFINEFKEFCFEPELTGSRAGREKVICAREGIRVSETKKLIIVKFNIQKEDKKELYFKELARVYNEITKILQRYDI